MSEERIDICEEQKKIDEKYMREAIRQAKKAYKLDETPIGCVIVHEGKIIGRGYNRRNTDKSPLAHAEITAIKKASKRLGDWRLEECTLYVTLEPCPMCAGAIINSRIKTVYYGASDLKAGSFGSVVDFNSLPYNHKPEIVSGVMQDEARKMLSDFFKGLREKKKSDK